MHRIAFILAIQFAVLSTQPIWQPLKQALFGSCGASKCSSTTATAGNTAPTLPGCPSGSEQEGQTTEGCCMPFQCCFPCCCYCQQTAKFPDFAEIKDNARPNEDTKALHSINLGEHFQPPEFA